MDYQEVDRVLRQNNLAAVAAFDQVRIAIEPIHSEGDIRPLGLYDPDLALITLPPDARSGTLLHELGHRFGHYYHNDLSEGFAEDFRKTYDSAAPLYHGVPRLMQCVRYSSEEVAAMTGISLTDRPRRVEESLIGAVRQVIPLDRVRMDFGPGRQVHATQLLDSWTGAIASVAQQYLGKITRVVIVKGGALLDVPASLAVKDNVELHAFGRNDGAAVKMIMAAYVYKPDGTRLYGSYSMITKQDPGQTLAFSIMNLAIDQPGQWSADIAYYASF